MIECIHIMEIKWLESLEYLRWCYFDKMLKLELTGLEFARRQKAIILIPVSIFQSSKTAELYTPLSSDKLVWWPEGIVTGISDISFCYRCSAWFLKSFHRRRSFFLTNPIDITNLALALIDNQHSNCQLMGSTCSDIVRRYFLISDPEM